MRESVNLRAPRESRLFQHPRGLTHTDRSCAGAFRDVEPAERRLDLPSELCKPASAAARAGVNNCQKAEEGSPRLIRIRSAGLLLVPAVGQAPGLVHCRTGAGATAAARRRASAERLRNSKDSSPAGADDYTDESSGPRARTLSRYVYSPRTNTLSSVEGSTRVIVSDLRSSVDRHSTISHRWA